MNATFPKSEKLCGERSVDELYKHGKRFVAWPMRVTYMEVVDEGSQVLIWAPKALFKHAVDRNRLRRQMREAYRLNKSILSSTPDKGLDIAFIWLTNKHHKSEMVVSKMISILKRIEQSRIKIDETTTQDT